MQIFEVICHVCKVFLASLLCIVGCLEQKKSGKVSKWGETLKDFLHCKKFRKKSLQPQGVCIKNTAIILGIYISNLNF